MCENHGLSQGLAMGTLEMGAAGEAAISHFFLWQPISLVGSRQSGAAGIFFVIL